MKHKKINLFYLGGSLLLLLTGYAPLSLGTDQLPINKTELYDLYPWSATFYYGWTVSEPLLKIPTANLKRWPETMQSIDLSHTLPTTHPLREFFSPWVNVVQVNLNLSKRLGQHQNNILEIAPYISLRWTNFPWNDYISTSFSVGEGISYVSSVPAIEQDDNSNTKRLLNLLMFEATFALPQHPQLQMVLQVHHRSGAYGLYQAGNTGSNNVGIGIRYVFDEP